MDTLRIGVIGVGHLGSLHAKMFSDMPGVLLSGVFDTDAGAASAVAGRYGIQPASTLDALLDVVDAVTVATSTNALAMSVIWR